MMGTGLGLGLSKHIPPFRVRITHEVCKMLDCLELKLL
jgi:hypothetical protein